MCFCAISCIDQYSMCQIGKIFRYIFIWGRSRNFALVLCAQNEIPPSLMFGLITSKSASQWNLLHIQSAKSNNRDFISSIGKYRKECECRPVPSLTFFLVRSSQLCHYSLYIILSLPMLPCTLTPLTNCYVGHMCLRQLCRAVKMLKLGGQWQDR